MRFPKEFSRLTERDFAVLTHEGGFSWKAIRKFEEEASHPAWDFTKPLNMAWGRDIHTCNLGAKIEARARARGLKLSPKLREATRRFFEEADARWTKCGTRDSADCPCNAK